MYQDEIPLGASSSQPQIMEAANLENSNNFQDAVAASSSKNNNFPTIVINSTQTPRLNKTNNDENDSNSGSCFDKIDKIGEPDHQIAININNEMTCSSSYSSINSKNNSNNRSTHIKNNENPFERH